MRWEGHRRLYEHLKTKAKELPETIEEMAPLYAAVVHGCQAGKNQEAFDEVWWTRIKREEQHFNWRTLGAFGSQIAVPRPALRPPPPRGDAHLGHARLSLAEADPTAARDHLAIARRIITETCYHRRDGELAALVAACR